MVKADSLAKGGTGKSGSAITDLARGLSAEQRAALQQLGQGRSVRESAELAGVDRATLYRWIKSNPAFGAAYNRWKEELEESCRARLLTLGEKATAAVEGALDRGDQKTAMQLLEGMGMIRPPEKVLTEEEQVRQRAELDVKKTKMDMEAEERKLEEQVRADEFVKQCYEEMATPSKRGRLESSEGDH